MAATSSACETHNISGERNCNIPETLELVVGLRRTVSAASLAPPPRSRTARWLSVPPPVSTATSTPSISSRRLRQSPFSSSSTVLGFVPAVQRPEAKDLAARQEGEAHLFALQGTKKVAGTGAGEWLGQWLKKWHGQEAHEKWLGQEPEDEDEAKTLSGVSGTAAVQHEASRIPELATLKRRLGPKANMAADCASNMESFIDYPSLGGWRSHRALFGVKAERAVQDRIGCNLGMDCAERRLTAPAVQERIDQEDEETATGDSFSSCDSDSELSFSGGSLKFAVASDQFSEYLIGLEDVGLNSVHESSAELEGRQRCGRIPSDLFLRYTRS